MKENVKVGRKAIPEAEKKTGYKIYITKEQQLEIEQFGIGTSFSERCVNLMNLAVNSQKQEQDNTIRFIDLFAGLGGIRIGFENAAKELGINTRCVLSSEIKKYAVKVYLDHFQEEKINGDITKIKTEKIPDFDVLLAGFPCQPFSQAGLGLGFADTRGTLFFQIERILKEKKDAGHPVSGFLLENVEGLVNHDGGNTLKVILGRLKELGYDVNYKVLDSMYFGLAQSRKRIYIVGTLSEKVDLENFTERTAVFGEVIEKGLPVVNSSFTKKLLKYYTVEQLPGKAIKDKRGGKDNIHSWDIDLKGTTTAEEKYFLNILLKERRKKHWAEDIGIDWMDGMPLTVSQIMTFYQNDNLQVMLDDLVKKKYLVLEHPKKLVVEYDEQGKKISSHREEDTTKPKGYNIVAGKLSFEFSKILAEDEMVPTLVAMDVMKMGVIDGEGIRHLSVKEGQRLCGYDPETYDLSIIKDSEAFDLLGNTVCVPVIQDVSKRLISTLVKK